MGIKRSRSDSLSSEAESTISTRSRETSVKIVHLDGAAATPATPVMKCSLPPHQPLTFKSFEDYDVHYQKTHVNRCQECRKNFPDEHFLHLHIAENHDPFFAAKRDRGEKMYACLLPTCPRPCSAPQKRRLHMIDKHQFPKDYDFFIVNNGIDKRNSMLRPQHRRGGSGVNGSNGGRTRGESNASAMEIVKEQKQEAKVEEKEMELDEESEEESSEEEESEEESSEEEESPTTKSKAPVKATANHIQPAKSTKPAQPLNNNLSPSEGETSSEEETSDEEDSGDENAPARPKASAKPSNTARSPKPLKLRGRGGFGRVGQRGTPSGSLAAAPSTSAASSASMAPKASDPIDSLTSGMSALQFIPNSVRKARERAKSSAKAAGK